MKFGPTLGLPTGKHEEDTSGSEVTRTQPLTWVLRRDSCQSFPTREPDVSPSRG
jgi:hypothetical protein